MTTNSMAVDRFAAEVFVAFMALRPAQALVELPDEILGVWRICYAKDRTESDARCADEPPPRMTVTCVVDKLCVP